jgi:hypothetical protein
MNKKNVEYSMRPVRAVISAWTLVLAAALSTALLVAVVAAPAVAQASITHASMAQASVGAPSAKLLVDARTASKLGFPIVITKSRSTGKTGTTFCPKATYAAYADKRRSTGMTFTVFACTSAESGAQVMSELGKDATALPEVSLPPSLGAGTFLLAQPPGYNVWFQRGKNVVQVAFTADLTQKNATALTAAQGKVLVAAAVRQAERLDAKK